jgi:predicted ABC-type ATPase
VKKNIYIIAGCNGAGKTTASFTILPTILKCKEFVNADEIAKGLSPFQPESVALEAGRIMLKRIDELLQANTTFAFETTLATKSYKQKVLAAQLQGYTVTLLFFWLRNETLAIKRVQTRVKEGGHNIPADVIRRRYSNGIRNLFNIYLLIVDKALLFDNSNNKPTLIATKSLNKIINIIDDKAYQKMKTLSHEKL